MRTFHTEAIILRRTNFGEADRILNVLTPDMGKLSAIAKGVRKSKSKLAGGLELFATCDIGIMEGRSEMGVVTSARLIKFYGGILRQYERMQLGYELIKIINKTAETVGESDFYYLLRDSFAYLDEPSIDYTIVELWFRLRFATLLGRGLNLATGADGNRLEAEARYNFDFYDMVFTHHPSGRFTSEHVKFLRLAHAKTPAILRQVSGLESVLEDCLWLVRSIEN